MCRYELQFLILPETFFCSEVDQYGFERPEDFDYESYESFMSSYLRVLARRASKWEKLLGNKPVIHHSSKGIFGDNLFPYQSNYLKNFHKVINF